MPSFIIKTLSLEHSIIAYISLVYPLIKFAFEFHDQVMTCTCAAAESRDY